jgi:hypothetical protein
MREAPTATHTEHQLSANYYAVAQPACANTDDAVYENGTMPMVDKYEEMEYFASMPEDALLQIMSANNTGMGVDKPGPAPLIEVYATAIQYRGFPGPIAHFRQSPILTDARVARVAQ